MPSCQPARDAGAPSKEAARHETSPLVSDGIRLFVAVVANIVPVMMDVAAVVANVPAISTHIFDIMMKVLAVVVDIAAIGAQVAAVAV
jgi:hypothetical protein